MAFCFNTNDPKYKEILELHGPSTPFLLNAMRILTGIDKLPGLKQFNAFLNESKNGMTRRLVKNLNLGEGYTKEQIVRNLRGIVHESDNVYYITKGFGSYHSLVQQAERKKAIFEDNMRRMVDLQKQFPNVFTIEKYGNNKYSYRVLINDVAPKPSKYIFSNFVTEGGKNLKDLGITKEEFDSLNDEEREALKRCN